MSNWIPAGSVAYDTAYADGAYTTEATDDGTVPYFSTIPYRGPTVRNPKQCRGNDWTCKGFKSSGTDFCAGHLKSHDKALAVAAAKLAALDAH